MEKNVFYRVFLIYMTVLAHYISCKYSCNALDLRHVFEDYYRMFRIKTGVNESNGSCGNMQRNSDELCPRDQKNFLTCLKCTKYNETKMYIKINIYNAYKMKINLYKII